MERDASALPDSSAELLRELFWRSSMRVAILDGSSRIIITSKAFRDAFPSVIGVAEGRERVTLEGKLDGDTLPDRLAKLPPGERIDFTVRVPFAGVENSIRIEVAGLHSRHQGEQLYLTEWIPEGDREAFSRSMVQIEESYRELQENLPVGVYRAVEEGLIQTTNSALIRMMGFESFEALQSARLHEVWVHPEQRTKMIERLRDEGFVLGYEVTLRRADGTELEASFDARGTFDSEGNLVYFDTIVQDITERVEAQRRLEQMARTDSLTGLCNRQHLMERFEAELARSCRYDRPLSVMMIDLDHFKQVNDGYGHLAGDEVLVAAASVISRTLRGTDFVGRYGGEEFLAVLPETPLKGALDLAERLRSAMEDACHRMPCGDRLEVTCSIGVAEAVCDEVEEIIDLADAAMYAAKRAGRNAVMSCLTN